jgi:hypothetical protein
MVATPEQIRDWRDDACENIERIDSARGLTPGAEHLNALLRPREARILTLCDALLDILPNGSAEALELVWDERRRQIERWGGPTGDGVENPNTPNPVRLRVLVEEVGEVAEAMGRPEDGNGIRDLRTELVQVAAVAVAWVEALTEADRS